MAEDKKKEGVFSDFEKQAMRDRAKELRAQERSDRTRKDGEEDVKKAITAMLPNEQEMANKIHEIVSNTAPQLFPKTWYGMPAYANQDGKVVCFFQAGTKYESRYSTLGFQDSAKLDEGNMWAAGFALVKISKAEEAKITELVKKAVK